MFMVSARYRKARWPGEEEAPVSVEENNKALVRKFFEEVWSRSNVAALDEFLAPDFVVHDLHPKEEAGTEDYKRAVAEQLASSSDLHFSIEEQIAEGDMVVTCFIGSGTHDLEELKALAPSGVRITIENIVIDRVVEEVFARVVDRLPITRRPSPRFLLPGLHF